MNAWKEWWNNGYNKTMAGQVSNFNQKQTASQWDFSTYSCIFHNFKMCKRENSENERKMKKKYKKGLQFQQNAKYDSSILLVKEITDKWANLKHSSILKLQTYSLDQTNTSGVHIKSSECTFSTTDNKLVETRCV